MSYTRSMVFFWNFENFNIFLFINNKMKSALNFTVEATPASDVVASCRSYHDVVRTP